MENKELELELEVQQIYIITTESRDGLLFVLHVFMYLSIH